MKTTPPPTIHPISQILDDLEALFLERAETLRDFWTFQHFEADDDRALFLSLQDIEKLMDKVLAMEKKLATREQQNPDTSTELPILDFERTRAQIMERIHAQRERKRD